MGPDRDQGEDAGGHHPLDEQDEGQKEDLAVGEDTIGGQAKAYSEEEGVEEGGRR